MSELPHTDKSEPLWRYPVTKLGVALETILTALEPHLLTRTLIDFVFLSMKAGDMDMEAGHKALLSALEPEAEISDQKEDIAKSLITSYAKYPKE